MGQVSDCVLVAEDATFAKMRTFLTRRSPPWQRIAPADAVQRFVFDPGHPKDGHLYLKHPYRPEVLLLPASANERIAQDKLAAFVSIAQDLGASEIRIVSAEARETSAVGSIGLAGIGASLGLKTMISDSGEVARVACFTFGPPRTPIGFRPQHACWLIENPTLKALVEGRLRNGNIQSALVELAVQNSVERGLEADVSKFKIGIGGELRTVTSSSWRFEVRFWDVVAPTAPTPAVAVAPPVQAAAASASVAPPRPPPSGARLDAGARKLITQLSVPLRGLVEFILSQLPAEVAVCRDTHNGHEYLELTSAVDPEWKAWIGPRANEVFVAVFAAPEDTIGWSTTTYADRMVAVGLPDVRDGVPEWGKDSRYINTVVTPASDPLTVAVTAGYLRWFLVEDPRASGGPRLPPRSAEWVRSQPPEFLEQLDVLLSSLPPATKVIVLGGQAAKYIQLKSAIDPEFVAWIGYKGDRLYVAFDASDEDVVGESRETYWQRLQALGYADTFPTMPEWKEGQTINVVIPRGGAAAATQVAEYLCWYVRDAPKL